MLDFSEYDFASVMDYPDELYVFNLSETYDPEFIRSKEWGIGKYNEKRTCMYLAPQYGGRRNIHMGVDLWTSAGAPVYAFWEGKVVYMEDHDQDGNYGPVIVTCHRLGEQILFALHGHLSRESFDGIREGQALHKGQKIAELGTQDVNGGWAPHLHFQLSVSDPGEADMPGVVSDREHEKAMTTYPDPRLVLGKLY